MGRYTEGVSGVVAKSPSHANSVLRAETAGSRVSKYARSSPYRCCELLPTPHARTYQTVAASQQESMLGSPSRIVVRTLGVPYHHVGEAKLTTFPIADRLGRKNVGAVHPKSTRERPKLRASHTRSRSPRARSRASRHASTGEPDRVRPRCAALATVRIPVRRQRRQRAERPRHARYGSNCALPCVRIAPRPEIPVGAA